MLNTPLIVWRTLADGQKIRVGTLAENREGSYFQYVLVPTVLRGNSYQS